MGFSKLFETSAATMPTKTFPNLIAVQSVAILRGCSVVNGHPRFLLGPLFDFFSKPPRFFHNFPFQIVWLTFTVENFRPAIF